ncbi:hypothetical protein CLAIMM_09720, partial [Cladophialophora immunda]
SYCHECGYIKRDIRFHLTKDPNEGWVSKEPPLQLRLDCGNGIVQLLKSETTNRSILSTRETDYLWDSNGKQLATRPYLKTPGIRLWIQHPQSQSHVICIEGEIARICSWDDWTEVSSL